MAKTGKTTAAAPETAQKAQEQQSMSQNTQGQETASETAQGTSGLYVEYAVTAGGGLRLRGGPSTDAPIIAVLPRGAGVLGDGELGPDGWCHVRTGRLEGWMMAQHLEALPMPEWPSLGGGKLPYAVE